MRVRPGFICVVGSILLFLAATLFLPERRGAKKARIAFTRIEEKRIAALLQERALANDGLTSIDDRYIVQALFGSNNLHPERINLQGKALDCWKTPYQIDIVATTNFVIRSAGPNQKFGDKDDIIFRSESNDFMGP